MFPAPREFSRRAMLCRAGGGFGAVALSVMLQRNARAESIAATPAGHKIAIDPLNPFTPRIPDFAPTAKSVIFLYMVGGPSQIDTFDYKPVLQKLDGQPVPGSLRKAVENSKFSNVFQGCPDKLMASPFKFQQYGQTGTWVSDLFPHLAQHVDDLGFVYSMQADSNNHGPASYELHTGDIRAGKASLGSWVTYGLGTENQNLPGYVVLFEAGPIGGAANYSNGFLPAAFQPTRLRDRGNIVMNLSPPADMASGQRDSLDLIDKLNLMHRQTRGNSEELDARIASYELAYRMQSTALDVGNLDSEPAFIRQSYGLESTEKNMAGFGRKCLLARRLVERGVRFVQLYDLADKYSWDAHEHLPTNHPTRARAVDQPIAALLSDLKARGLLDTTLVICASEFGRTPTVQLDHGRQHNAAGFTIWLAGGGIKPGARIGATDEIGLMATQNPQPFCNLHATILTTLGLSFDDLGFDISGRTERLTGVAGIAKPIRGLLA